MKKIYELIGQLETGKHDSLLEAVGYKWQKNPKMCQLNKHLTKTVGDDSKKFARALTILKTMLPPEDLQVLISMREEKKLEKEGSLGTKQGMRRSSGSTEWGKTKKAWRPPAKKAARRTGKAQAGQPTSAPKWRG